MGDLRPLGSEKLEGVDKLKRIMEIARYNEAPKSEINPLSTTNYSITLADGMTYGIVKEKSGYIIKKGLNESEMDYNEPMRQRKYFRSYSEAMKKLNLVAAEVNRVTGNDFEIPLIGEQEAKKKYVLKTPKPKAEEIPAPEPPAELPAETTPTPEPPASEAPLAGDEMGMGSPEGMGPDMGMDEPEGMEPDMGMSEPTESYMFKESVESVLSNYFVIKEEEKEGLEKKSKKNYLRSKINKIDTAREIRNLSESNIQYKTGFNLIEKNVGYRFVGKTNKSNLVFIKEGKEFKVTPTGSII